MLELRRCGRCDIALVLLSLVLPGGLLVVPASGRQVYPLQVTFEGEPGTGQASTTLARGLDSAGASVDILHAVWTTGERVYYRSGTTGNLSRPQLISRSGQERGTDPAVAVSNSGKFTLVWSAEITKNSGIVPDEWNLLITHSTAIVPSFLTEDERTTADTYDGHPTLAVADDSVYVAWERGMPPQVFFTLVTDRISVNDRQLVQVTTNAYPSTRPYIAANDGGGRWIVWTSFPTSGNGDIWATRVSGQKTFSTPKPIRRGSADDRMPSLAVDRDGRPHIVWQEGQNAGPIHYVYGLAGGGFSPIETLTPDGVAGQSPQITIGPDNIPRVMWQSADGGLDMTMVFGTMPLLPVNLISALYSPRQRVEGSGEVWPGLYLSAGGRLVTAFIAPDPIAQDNPRNIWVEIGTEEAAGSAIEGITAEAASGSSRLGSESVAVSVQPRPPGVQLRACPNPFNSTVDIVVSSDRSGHLTARIFSVAGRRVRTIARGANFPGADQRLVWDGRDDFGRPVASGIYCAVLGVDFDDGARAGRAIRLVLVR